MLKKRIPILLSLLLPLLAAVALMNTFRSPVAHAAPLTNPIVDTKEDVEPSRARGGNGITTDNVTSHAPNAGNHQAALSVAGAITVTTTTDEFGSGTECSLREAIQSANLDSDFDNCTRIGTAPYRINIPSGTYTLTIAGAGENDNASGDLDILAAMIISGTGDSNTVIDGNATDRVFDVISNTVIFDGLRIANGDAASEKGGGIIVQSGTAVTVTNSTFISNTGDYGGGIYNAGSLTVDNSRFYQNFASDIGGGGIYNVGELTVNATDVSGNSTLGDGGGIASSGGTAYIHSTSVANNQAEFSSGGIYGAEYTTLVVESSTISNNHTDGWGGGLLFDDGVVVTITNSTISGNIADEGAGAVSDDCDVAATITIIHSTIVNNSTPMTGVGGGFDMCTSTVTFQNSILAGNDNGSGPSNFVGDTVSQGYNLESGTDAGFTATGDLQNSDPNLLPLADNGGATWTHALSSGSLAVDHIPNGINGCGTTYIADQRDKPRPAGNGCDIGSYEKQFSIYLPVILK